MFEHPNRKYLKADFSIQNKSTHSLKTESFDESFEICPFFSSVRRITLSTDILLP